MEPRTRKKRLMFIAAFVFYLSGALFFFREAVFTERVPVCTDVLLNTYPWALSRSPDFTPTNLALSDHCTVFYPLYYHNAKHLSAGKLPLWTPYVLGGAPYMGGLGTAVWYPLNLLVAVIPLNLWFTIQSLIKIVGAGLLTYLLLRKYKLKFFPAFFGGAVYAFGGFTILWAISHLTSVALILPALLWATEVFLERRTGLSFLPIPMLLAIQFLGAMPEISMCLALSWMVYLLFRIRGKTGLFNKTGFAHLGALLGAGALSLGLVFFQLLPFMEYMVRSYGFGLRQQEAEARFLFGGSDPLFSWTGILVGLVFLIALWAAIRLFKRGKRPLSALGAGILAGGALWLVFFTAQMISLKPYFLIHFFPDLYGNPLAGVSCGGGIAFPEFNGGYEGTLPFLLALIGIGCCRKRAPVGIFSALLLFSLGAIYGLPFIYQLITAIPILNMAPSGRIVAISAFSISILSAFGLEHVLSALKTDRSARINTLLRGVGAALVVALPIAIWGLGLLKVPFFEHQGHPPSSESCETPGDIMLEQPIPGQQISSKEGLQATGKVGGEVTRLRFYLDGRGIGEATIAGSVGERAFHLSVPLNRIRGGNYRMGINVMRQEGDETFYTVPIQISHEKQFTQANLLLAALSAAVFLLLCSTRRFYLARGFLALVVVCVDFALLGSDYNTTSDPETIFPDNPVTDFLTANNGPHRILPENAILQPSTPYLYEYQIIRGYDGLELPEYNELLNWMKLDLWVNIHNYNSKTMDYSSNILDLLGVKYIVTIDDLSEFEGLRLAQDGIVKIYENTEVMPKAFIAGHWIEMDVVKETLKGDPAAAWEKLRPCLRNPPLERPPEIITSRKMMDYVKKRFNYRDWALTEEPLDCLGNGQGSAELVTYEHEYIRVDCSLQGEGVLMLTDNYFPGWEVWVDGIEQPHYRTTMTFRGVPLKQGQHKVEFFYRPGSLYLGAWISLISLVVVLLIGFIPLLRSARRTTSRSSSSES